MSGVYQVHEQSDRPRHARWQLPEEGISRVDVSALAILRHQQPALLVRFGGIVAREQWLKVIVPFVHVVQTALLNPAVEIFLRNLVWIMKDGIIRRENLHRSF